MFISFNKKEIFALVLKTGTSYCPNKNGFKKENILKIVLGKQITLHSLKKGHILTHTGTYLSLATIN